MDGGLAWPRVPTALLRPQISLPRDLRASYQAPQRQSSPVSPEKKNHQTTCHETTKGGPRRPLMGNRLQLIPCNGTLLNVPTCQAWVRGDGAGLRREGQWSEGSVAGPRRDATRVKADVILISDIFTVVTFGIFSRPRVTMMFAFLSLQNKPSSLD